MLQIVLYGLANADIPEALVASHTVHVTIDSENNNNSSGHFHTAVSHNNKHL